MTSRDIVRSKIQAFRRQGFEVEVLSLPAHVVQVYDRTRTYLSLSGNDASAFVAMANKLASMHALSIRDAYRLQAYRALSSHLQMALPLECQDPVSKVSQLPLMLTAERCVRSL